MRSALAVVAALLLLAIASAAHADTGSYRSLLPVGQGTNTTAADFAAQTLTGEPPAPFVNQRDMFEALLPIGTRMADGDLDDYFKPAPLDPPPGSTTITPKAGVEIARDAYAVPYVTGKTRADVSWGAGYAQAQDRLFFMDVLRHTARGTATELIGPGEDEVNALADAEQLAVADYTEAELQRMLDRAARTPKGAALKRALTAYTAGVNALIAEVRDDPAREPGEYKLLGKPLEDWKVTDTISLLGLLNGYFGLGGGGDLNAAEVSSAARKRFGRRAGERVYADFRALDDPEAPTVVKRRFGFDDPGPPRARAVAVPDAGSVTEARLLMGEGGEGDARDGAGPILAQGLRLRKHASNAMVIDADHAEGGHPLLVAGPQVGFYAPAILQEMSLRGPGIAVRGATIPGAGLPIAGRGRDFAWSVTTAQGDNTDVFAEKLCEPGGGTPTADSEHYLRRGRCVPFKIQERKLDWTPGPADVGGRMTPYSATVRILRSVHGPVIAHGSVGGAPVAFARARASYFHEIDAALGLGELSARPIKGPRDFQRAIAQVSGSYNWFYADSEHIAYVQSGRYPRRAKGTDPDLPTWGTGRFDWRGRLGFRRLPQAIDPKRGYMVSWNQKQAPGWRSSDADWQYGPVHRSQRLERRVRSAMREGRVGLGDLAAIMGNAGTVDVRGQEVLPWLLRVIGRKPSAEIAPAVRVLRAWVKSGAHRRDADLSGSYDNSAAVALMDAWWRPMVDAIYRPVLGKPLFDAIAHVNQVDYLPTDGPDTYYYGWYGYVQKDLRSLLGKRVRGAYSRGYCGRGRLGRCRATLERTLAAAAQQVGDLDTVAVAPTCPESVPQTCDQLQFTAAGAITVPPVPWQDRGSWQQVVQVTSRASG